MNRGDLVAIRSRLEPYFSLDTAAHGTHSNAPSAGHCAAVALIVREIFGGELVSAIVAGQSHWFSRIDLGGIVADADLTGDQFGLPAVQTAPAGELYQATRVRIDADVKPETVSRAELLARRADLLEAAVSVRRRMTRPTPGADGRM